MVADSNRVCGHHYIGLLQSDDQTFFSLTDKCADNIKVFFSLIPIYYILLSLSFSDAYPSSSYKTMASKPPPFEAIEVNTTSTPPSSSSTSSTSTTSSSSSSSSTSANSLKKNFHGRQASLPSNPVAAVNNHVHFQWQPPTTSVQHTVS